jgi:exopolysaccharide biosynthesis polyprenyl glycosylphosphotransferase
LALASTLAVWVPSLVDDRWGGGQEALLWLLLPPAWLLGRVLLDLTRRRRPEAVLIVGGGEVAARIATLMERERRERSRIVGCVDDDPPWANEGLPLLGGIDDLPRALQDHQVDRVVVTFSRRRDADSLRVLQACDDFGVDVDVVPRMFDLVGHAPRSYTLGGLALLNVRGQRPSPYQRFGKRSFDLLVAGGALLVLAPLFAATALAIALDDGRPVFFRQRRVGRGVQPFTILKFRTMAAAEAVGTGARPGPDRGTPGIADVVRLRKDDAAPRVTRVGRHLRHTSLDELPQLLNVVRGDMSLVGPRPLQSYEVEALDSWQERRQQMRPGITGLWQVLGRSDINWDERMQLDYSYVRHWSIASDLRILAGTLPAVVSRRGAV